MKKIKILMKVVVVILILFVTVKLFTPLKTVIPVILQWMAAILDLKFS